MKGKSIGLLFALFAMLIVYFLINMPASTDSQSAAQTPVITPEITLMIVLSSNDIDAEPTPAPAPPELTALPEPTASQEPTARPIINPDVDPSRPMVALTFDDGPSMYTPDILDILERNNCRATFCVIGNRLDTRKDMVRRAFDLGCEIFGHSWDHRNFTKIKAETIKQELRDTTAAIDAITGYSPMLYRPPLGAYDDKVMKASAELGYSLVNWSVDSRDWSRKDAKKVYNGIMHDVFDRSIILCHDLYGSTVEAMERVIPDLLAKGYQLVTVSELMYYSDISLKPGKLYRSGIK